LKVQSRKLKVERKPGSSVSEWSRLERAKKEKAYAEDAESTEEDKSGEKV